MTNQLINRLMHTLPTCISRLPAMESKAVYCFPLTARIPLSRYTSRNTQQARGCFTIPHKYIYRQVDIGLCRIALIYEEEITTRVKQRGKNTQEKRVKKKEKEKDRSHVRCCGGCYYLKKVSHWGCD